MDSTAPGIFALGESNDVAVQRMKEQACMVGAHGLMKVDANSQGVWTGDGYSKSTTGGPSRSSTSIRRAARCRAQRPANDHQPGAYPNLAAGGPTQASWAPPPPQAAPAPALAPPPPAAASPE